MSENGSTVQRLGEDIIYDNQTLKASLEESTQATFSLAGRAYYVQGQILKGNPEIKQGELFSRLCEPNEKYTIITLLPEPYASDLFFLYAYKCNAKVSIYRLESPEITNGKRFDDITGDRLDSKTFELIYSNVYVFSDTVVRSFKELNDGLDDQTIYTMLLPHEYGISVLDRVALPTTINGTNSTKNLRVDSISNALIGISSTGIDQIQLSFDTRS